MHSLTDSRDLEAISFGSCGGLQTRCFVAPLKGFSNKFFFFDMVYLGIRTMVILFA